MRKELLNKANLAWLVLSIVSFVVLTILMKVGIIGSYYSITLYNIFINIILAVYFMAQERAEPALAHRHLHGRGLHQLPQGHRPHPLRGRGL